MNNLCQNVLELNSTFLYPLILNGILGSPVALMIFMTTLIRKEDDTDVHIIISTQALLAAYIIFGYETTSCGELLNKWVSVVNGSDINNANLYQKCLRSESFPLNMI